MTGDLDPSSALRLSRTKLALFLECQRCFYLSIARGLSRIDSGPLRLHLAVDTLLKKEFNDYRLRGEPHPVMITFGVDAVPHTHPELEQWRDFRRGVSAHHIPSNIELYGAIDDLWRHADGRLSVVDYKATSSATPVTYTDDRHHGYHRQLDVYHWLLQHNDLPMAAESYWLIANADARGDGLNGALRFSLSIAPYRPDPSWIPDALIAARECVSLQQPPPPSAACTWCRYARQVRAEEGNC